MDYFKSEAIKIKDELINLRRELHRYPEIGMEEYKTAKYIKRYLSEVGIEFVSVAKTGISGIIHGTKKEINKKVIALRADIDGLPITDRKKCDYASKINGMMHACGHDAHMAILLGAAKILNNNKHLFSGSIKIIFEPAEETVGGAQFMIEQGVLEDPYVDVISGLHVEEGLECGKVMARAGGVNAASNPFTIKVKGGGGHGAYPHETVDPVVVASEIIMSMQSIISREMNTLHQVVITVGSIHGGTAPNIIPQEVEMRGIIRTINKEDREFVKKRINEVVNGICIAKRAVCDIEIQDSYPSLHNDENMFELFEKVAKDTLGKENVVHQSNPKMGVESFSYFASERPGIFYFLGCGNKEKEIIYPAHSSFFDIDEECLIIGVTLQCKIALEYLTIS